MKNARKIAEILQKAKFEGKSAADALKEMQANENKKKAKQISNKQRNWQIKTYNH